MCESCGCGERDDVIEPHRHKPSGREVPVGRSLLEENDLLAGRNRAFLQKRRIFTVNLLGSPGAGKTTLLLETVKILSERWRIGIITGDQVGDEDRRRLESPGVWVHQIETGRMCHLDAHLVGHSLEEAPEDLDILFIENVGNLVCPALFDLGESRKVVLLSVAEGADKPSKYPEMFRWADLVLVGKTDLLPYVEFDGERAKRDLGRLRGPGRLIELSAKNHDGISEWVDWIERNAALVKKS
ncbi:MAG: hydrogenase accessory protein HypB [Candidatus Hydrogenedentota bacterium]|nr:MAG: hydrogenase accessory protein HypB [Candidatus Hydrogenedentota bacterium]